MKVITQGEYFGENSLLFKSTRSATIESINYCTLAQLHTEHLRHMFDISPELHASMKERALSLYYDEWIEFKCYLLR